MMVHKKRRQFEGIDAVVLWMSQIYNIRISKSTKKIMKGR